MSDKRNGPYIKRIATEERARWAAKCQLVESKVVKSYYGLISSLLKTNDVGGDRAARLSRDSASGLWREQKRGTR